MQHTQIEADSGPGHECLQDAVREQQREGKRIASQLLAERQAAERDRSTPAQASRLRPATRTCSADVEYLTNPISSSLPNGVVPAPHAPCCLLLPPERCGALCQFCIPANIVELAQMCWRG